MPDGPLPSFGVRADFWSLRFVDERCESYAVRKNVAMPYVASTDSGVMATVYVDGGYGYAATGDSSAAGFRAGTRRAMGARYREARPGRHPGAALRGTARRVRVTLVLRSFPVAPRMV